MLFKASAYSQYNRDKKKVQCKRAGVLCVQGRICVLWFAPIFSPIDFRCKRGTGGRGGSSSSGSMTSSSSGAAAAVAVGGASNSNSSSINSSISSNSASGGGGANSKGSSGSSSRSEKSSRPTRIPFHKRVLMAMPFEGLVKVQATQQQSHRLNKSRPESGGKGTSAAAAALVVAGPSTGQPASKSTSLFNILPQRLVPCAAAFANKSHNTLSSYYYYQPQSTNAPHSPNCL